MVGAGNGASACVSQSAGDSEDDFAPSLDIFLAVSTSTVVYSIYNLRNLCVSRMLLINVHETQTMIVCHLRLDVQKPCLHFL